MSIEAYQEREKRGDFRAGVIASVLANANRDPKRHRQPFQPRDFFPSLLPPRRVQTPEQQRDALIAFAKVTGGRIVYKPREQAVGS